MCYMNCEHENNAGECKKPRNAPCPADFDDEDELSDAVADYEDARIEQYENQKEEKRLMNERGY